MTKNRLYTVTPTLNVEVIRNAIAPVVIFDETRVVAVIFRGHGIDPKIALAEHAPLLEPTFFAAVEKPALTRRRFSDEPTRQIDVVPQGDVQNVLDTRHFGGNYGGGTNYFSKT